MAYGRLHHIPVLAQVREWGGEGRTGDLPPWVSFHMAELLALQSHSVQNYNSFTQKQAFALHFTFFIIFLMCVTFSSDLNAAEKIT